MEFLNTMSAAGKPLDGYEQAPDQKAAFRHLLGSGDDDEASLPPDKLRALCEAHRAKFPDDPRLHYESGLLFERERNLQEAEREFRAAIEHADEDEADLFRGALFSLLDESGRTLEAYTEVFPAEEAFQRLVQIRRWKTTANELSEVYTKHLAAHPDDPWLDSYASVVERNTGNKEEALRLALHGYEAAAKNKDANDTVLRNYRWQVVDLALDTGKPEFVYNVSETPDEALRTLVQRSNGSNSQVSVRAVLEQHQQTHAATPIWKLLQSQEQWKDRDYAGVVITIGPNLEELLAELPDWDAERLADYYVGSLRQMGNVDQARTLAETVCNDWGKTRPLLSVLVHGGNLPEVERLLGEFGIGSWKISGAYGDPEIGALLRRPEFLPVRQSFPPQAAAPYSSTGVVLLLDEPSPVSADSLLAAARIVLGDDTAVEPLGAPPGESSAGIAGRWLLRSDPMRIAVVAGSDRYASEPSPGMAGPQSESLIKALERHHAWLSLRWLGSDCEEQQARVAATRVYRLAARLRDEHCLAIELPSDNRLVENSPELGAKLEADDPRAELLRLGESLWLSRHRELELDEPTDPAVAFSRSLPGFAAAFEARLPGQAFEIGILLRHDDVAELLKLHVESVARAPYGGRTYRGTLAVASNLWPELAAGEPYIVSEYQIAEWSYVKGDQVERAARW